MKKIYSILILILCFLLFVAPSHAGIQFSDQFIHSGGERWGIQLRQNNYSKYAFYADFGTGKDKVSGDAMLTVLSAGRFDAAGNSYGENTPVIDGGGLNGYGAFTQMVGKTEDLTHGSWSTVGSPVTRTPTSFATLNADTGIKQAPLVEFNTMYIYSFKAYAAPGSALDNYVIYHEFAQEGDSTPLTLTYAEQNYSVTITSHVGIPVFNNLGIQDTVGGNTVFCTDFQLTESKYQMPYVPNNTSFEVVVPNNYADADEGNKWLLSNHPKLVASLADQGQLDIIDWQPKFNAADVSGIISILTVNDTAVGFLYYDADNQLLKAFDGTNTATVACTPVKDQKYKISLVWGTLSGSQMQLFLDGSPGSAVSFDGEFETDTDMSSAWDAVDWQIKKKIKIYRGPQAW